MDLIDSIFWYKDIKFENFKTPKKLPNNLYFLLYIVQHLKCFFFSFFATPKQGNLIRRYDNIYSLFLSMKVIKLKFEIKIL